MIPFEDFTVVTPAIEDTGDDHDDVKVIKPLKLPGHEMLHCNKKLFSHKSNLLKTNHLATKSYLAVKVILSQTVI